MKILIACEESGKVRDAFLAKGHDAWSCDLLPTRSNPERHIQGDVIPLLAENWDMIIAFPPCTHLCCSGARHFEEKRKDGRQQEGIDFFMLFANHTCERMAIENPVGIMSTIWRKPDQIIQPWQFGHDASKATCLWLRGLPLLSPTEILPRPSSGRWGNQSPCGANKLGPSPDRSRLRSETYTGIASAMAEQWG